MEDLPVNTNHPAVRDYLALIRLQVLTPLSLLINVASVAVCAFLVHPSLGGVSRLYPTSISPNPPMVAIYIIAIYVGQIGYCVLLVTARKPETKKALIQGSGLSLVLANWIMALWAISWVLQWFILSSVLLGLLVLLLLYSNIVLLVYHPPTSSRPFDTALIHAPMRLFLILPLMLTLSQSIFIAVGHYWLPNCPLCYDRYEWEGFGVIFSLNFLGLLIIAIRRDIVWCAGAVWVCASVWRETPKSGPVQATVITFTALHIVVLVLSIIYAEVKGRREGPIALPPDDDEEVQRVRARE
ncbi:hypothetical protein BD410DRAFT_752127 [Rickenella mellea]|uniref:Uncharacterized protein n=1 Tax=Rickenella mellea TaxID=50990 RepID=A0A4Y7PWL3_9AGAM|nr:hypothetical protein BD410DRAFT_752127 [Rickenella mellea]